MATKKTRGRKAIEAYPVRESEGKWVRLARAQKLIRPDLGEISAHTVYKLADSGQVRTTVIDDLTMYFVKKEDNAEE